MTKYSQQSPEFKVKKQIQHGVRFVLPYSIASVPQESPGLSHSPCPQPDCYRHFRLRLLTQRSMMWIPCTVRMKRSNIERVMFPYGAHKMPATKINSLRYKLIG